MAEVSLALSLSGNSFKLPLCTGRLESNGSPSSAALCALEDARTAASAHAATTASATDATAVAGQPRRAVLLCLSQVRGRVPHSHSRRESSRRRSKAPINRAARSPSCESWLSRAGRRHAAGSDWPGRFPAEPGRRSQVERGPAPNAGIGFGVCPLKVVRSRGAYLNLACTMAWYLLHARIR